jgi:hypothetical protein
VHGPTQRGISQGGNPTGLELGAGWIEVALARRQPMGWSHLDNTAETEVGVVEDPPDQVRAIESGGGTGGRWVGGKGWGKIGLGEVEEEQREVCEGEGDAFGAGSNNIYTLAAVVGKGWTKGKSAVFGTREGKEKLARGVNVVSGEVVWETVEARPGREGRIGLPGAHDVEVDFGIGEETVP